MKTIHGIALLAFSSIVFLLHPAAASATVCGDAYFNAEIHWSTSSSPLYYTIASAPPNTCGNLWTNRNGRGWVMESAGWICTDGNGTATKGPWYASNQSGDETAYSYIDYGTCTSPVRKHIWDIASPTIVIISPPGAGYFNGSATDGSWGAGFSTGWNSSCLVKYYDSTDQFWWSPYAGWNEPYPYVIGTTTSVTNFPSLNITWSATQVPNTLANHCYTWYAQCWDGGHWGEARQSFCK
jgi:hypothetical protein